jgi:hemerythrin superfamily protein
MTVTPTQVQRYLGDVHYPTDKKHLVEKAREHGADRDVVQTLQAMPGERFNTPNDVSQAVGKQTQTQQQDIVDILLAQHTEIKQLFAQVTSAQGPLKEELFHDLVRLLAVHEGAEEQVVHPAARNIIPNGDQIIDERLHEESDAKQALSDLYDLGVDHPEFDRRLGTLGESVLAHATQEEHKELEQLRKHADADRLRLMARAFEAAEALAPTRPHPAAGESAVANLFVGPPIAVFDKVRDAMRDWRKRVGEA